MYIWCSSRLDPHITTYRFIHVLDYDKTELGTPTSMVFETWWAKQKCLPHHIHVCVQNFLWPLIMACWRVLLNLMNQRGLKISIPSYHTYQAMQILVWHAFLSHPLGLKNQLRVEMPLRCLKATPISHPPPSPLPRWGYCKGISTLSCNFNCRHVPRMWIKWRMCISQFPTHSKRGLGCI